MVDDEFQHQSCQEMGYAPILANATISINHFSGFSLGLTLTLLLWDYVSWRFTNKCDEGFCFSDSVLGIPATYIGLLSIFTGLILIVLCVGFLYDRVFSLWTAQRSVDIERNPFWTYA